MQNWVVDFDATQVIDLIVRSSILTVKDVRFIKDFIMLLWEFRDTSGMKFKNYWLSTEMLR